MEGNKRFINQNSFHHAGTMMMALFLATELSAFFAKIFGDIGLNFSIISNILFGCGVGDISWRGHQSGQ